MKKLISWMMALVLLAAVPGLALAAEPSEAQVKGIIYAMQAEYPEKAEWPRDRHYDWQGGIFAGGNGGIGFLFMVSDAAFGSLPARMVNTIDYDALKPGDILRIKNNTHSVMVLEKYEDHVTVLETQVDTRGVNRVHWGRTLSQSAVLEGDYVLTRYASGGSAPSVLPGDVNVDGTVDGRDLLRLARYLSGQQVEANAKAADVNGDGSVDGRDLLRLAKHLAGQDVELK
jgi:hypothetical protein